MLLTELIDDSREELYNFGINEKIKKSNPTDKDEYSAWLRGIFDAIPENSDNREGLFLNDLPLFGHYLKIFDEVKDTEDFQDKAVYGNPHISTPSDITQYTTINQLYKSLYYARGKMSQMKISGKELYQAIMYSVNAGNGRVGSIGNEWIIYTPNNKVGSMLSFGGKPILCSKMDGGLTEWCSTSDDNKLYENYINNHEFYRMDGTKPVYYILINKKVFQQETVDPTDNFYLMHFQSKKFIDDRGRTINLKNFLSHNQELLPFLQREYLKPNIEKDIRMLVKLWISGWVNYINPSTDVLDLSDMGITGIPEDIGRLAKLKKLVLSNNNIQILTPKLGDLRKLEWLDLSNNQLVKLPNEIGNLRKLKRLLVSGNKLTTLPESIGNLVDLFWLNISDNKLTALPNSVGFMKNIRRLFLRNNQMTTIPPTLGNITNLTWLNLSENKIEVLPETIANMRNVKFFYLTENKLRTLPKSIRYMVNLVRLSVDENQLVQLPYEISLLPKLKKLNIHHNNLGATPAFVHQMEMRGVSVKI
jgi:hypothetical protein